MVLKSENRFVLGTKRIGTRSPERMQNGLSLIDTQGINGEYFPYSIGDFIRTT